MIVSFPPPRGRSVGEGGRKEEGAPHPVRHRVAGGAQLSKRFFSDGTDPVRCEVESRFREGSIPIRRSASSRVEPSSRGSTPPAEKSARLASEVVRVPKNLGPLGKLGFKDLSARGAACCVVLDEAGPARGPVRGRSRRGGERRTLRKTAVVRSLFVRMSSSENRCLKNTICWETDIRHPRFSSCCLAGPVSAQT